jgi:uncharacterized SAM-binding protein YcdF (DUF218 family)
MRTGVLVLGYHREDGLPGLSQLALSCVRRAERLAGDRTIEVVVCSGFARDGGAPEGALMRDAWAGPEVPVVAETEARDTVENATLSLPVLREHRIERLLVVCAASHVPRVRLLLTGYFARHGIDAEVVPVWRPFPLRRLVWELRALRWVPAFRRRLASA